MYKSRDKYVYIEEIENEIEPRAKSVKMNMERDVEVEMKELRKTFKSGITKEEGWRRSQLQNLLSLLVEKEDHIFQALEQDLGKHPVESFRDEVITTPLLLLIPYKSTHLNTVCCLQVGPLIKSVNFALKCLKKWMAPKKVKYTKVQFVNNYFF